MACACKVGQNLSYLEKKYGTNIPQSKKTNISKKVKLFFKKTFYVMICLPFIPIMFFYLLFRSLITKKPINIYKLFRIGV